MDIRSPNGPATSGHKLIEKLESSTLREAAPVKSGAEPSQQGAAVQQPASVPDMAQLTDAIKNLNKAMETRANDLEFSFDSENDKAVIKIIDQKTREVIRQIPSEEALEIASALDKATGLLFSQKA